MNSFSAVMSSLRPLLKAFVITIFTLLLSYVAIYDLTSVSFFSPMEKAADFRFSDFYTLVANHRAEASYEKDIAIVPVDGCTRSQIAEAISNIDFCAPAAVGLDIFFTPLQDYDRDALSAALADCDNLVMPVMVTADSVSLTLSHLSCYDEVVEPSGGFAAINIEDSEDNLDCVREFRKVFETAEGAVNTFAAALVGIGRPDAYTTLESRTHMTEEISYSSRKFEIVTPDEILENQDLIEGRIVLVGKLQDRGDEHITPLDNYTPGLMIHAYTIATIVNGDYIRQLSEWEEVVLGALLCFLVVWINLHLMTSVMGPLFVRSLQVGLLFFLIVTGTQAYIRLNIDLNFSYAILAVSLGVAVCEVYGAIFDQKGLIDFIYSKYKTIKSKIYEKEKNEENMAGCTSDSDFDDGANGTSRGTEDLQGEGGCDSEVGDIQP